MHAQYDAQSEAGDASAPLRSAHERDVKNANVEA
jgi:hypothetical protein